jgi:hypothetical protein
MDRTACTELQCLYKGALYFLRALVGSSADSHGGTTNILTIFDVYPLGLEHVLGYPRHSVPYSSFELLKIDVIDQIDEVFPHADEKKLIGVKSGDLGGHAYRAPLLN